MSQTYLDQLTEAKSKEGLWKAIAVGTLLVIAIQAIALVFVSVKMISNIDRVRYILAPGIQTLTTVRPGELPESYIEQSFQYITEKLNSWSYESIQSNYKTLFEQFYSGDLVNRTKANLNALGYFEDVEKRKLISFWTPIPAESEFHWCGKIAIGREAKGVACGIVTGEQRLFADHNIPVSKKNISYLVYAVNVAPNNTNFFAVQATRIKRGPFNVLKNELEASLKDGILPSQEDAYEGQ